MNRLRLILVDTVEYFTERNGLQVTTKTFLIVLYGGYKGVPVLMIAILCSSWEGPYVARYTEHGGDRKCLVGKNDRLKR